MYFIIISTKYEGDLKKVDYKNFGDKCIYLQEISIMT